MADVNSRQSLIYQYVTELQDLTFNSKPLINTLTMIASENPHAAVGFAEAIERRISTSAPAHKLPALYLLDSIVKNIGLPYTALFAKELPQLYMSVWTSNPDVRPSLTKLFNTWHRFFPADILATISQQSTNSQVSPPASLRQHQQPVVSYQPFHSTNAALRPQYQQQLAAPPMASAWQPAYPAQQQHAFAMANQQQGAALQSSAQSIADQYAAAYTPTYPQPQYTHQSPHVSHADALSGQNSGRTTPTLPQAQPGVPDILSQLISAGLIPAGKQGSAAAGGMKADQKAQPLIAPLVFNLSKSKEWLPLALKQLLDGTKATEAKFLDQRLHKKRKIAAGTKSSRTWFVKSTDWLAGTTADAQAAPAFFDEGQQAEETVAEEEATMPADPSQPACGISGERFDTFWDDATNSWRYHDAASLDAEQAEKYGLAEGTLVKVSCLDPVGKTSIEGATQTLAAAEGEGTADEVAAAASAMITDPQTKDDKDELADDSDGTGPKSPKKQRLS